MEDAGLPLPAHLVVGEAEDRAVVPRRHRREGEHGPRPVRDEPLEVVVAAVDQVPVRVVEAPVEDEVAGEGVHVAHEVHRLEGRHAVHDGGVARAHGRVCKRKDRVLIREKNKPRFQQEGRVACLSSS